MTSAPGLTFPGAGDLRNGEDPDGGARGTLAADDDRHGQRRYKWQGEGCSRR